MPTSFDEVWRQAALRGEQEAIFQLARAALQPLYRFCLYRVGRNHHLCEEVVQETMLHALRKLEQYEPHRADNNIFPWLTGLARNEIQRVLSREKSAASLQTMWANIDRELLTLYASIEAEPLPDEALRLTETRELVNATMAQLPPHYREALEAKYLAGKSVRDLADLWRLSEKAVESQLSRARQAFRATFTALARNLGPGRSAFPG